MMVGIDLKLRGLIIRLQLEFELVKRLLEIGDLAQKQMKALRLTPKVEVEEGSSSSASLEKDELKFQITLEESAIDYWPNISSMTFDKIFNEGIINVEYFGSEASSG